MNLTQTMVNTYMLIYILIFHYVLLSSIAGMAALWTAAKMLMMIAVLQASADESVHSTVRRPSQAPSETSMTDYNGFGDVTSSDDTTKLTFVDNFGKQELMLNKTIDMLVMLLQGLRRDTGKDTSEIGRTNKQKRYSGWFKRPRIFRSDLGKRSIHAFE